MSDDGDIHHTRNRAAPAGEQTQGVFVMPSSVGREDERNERPALAEQHDELQRFVGDYGKRNHGQDNQGQQGPAIGRPGDRYQISVIVVRGVSCIAQRQGAGIKDVDLRVVIIANREAGAAD